MGDEASDDRADGGNGGERKQAEGGRRDQDRWTWWSTFRHSPYFSATVVVVIIAAGAGLFAGSYTYAFANPTPHRIPTAVVVPGTPTEKAFVVGMEKALHASLRLHRYPTYRRALRAVDEQTVFAVLRPRGRGVGLDVSSASGASVAQVLTETGPRVGRALGVPVLVKDVNPLQRGDPRGLAIFYVSLAAVIIGFIGAIQLSVNARALEPAERIAFTAAYALLGGFSIAAIVDWGLGAVHLPFAESWMISR